MQAFVPDEPSCQHTLDFHKGVKRNQQRAGRAVGSGAVLLRDMADPSALIPGGCTAGESGGRKDTSLLLYILPFLTLCLRCSYCLRGAGDHD